MTLTRLLTLLSKKYKTNRRPERYFDVKKRGELSPNEIRRVERRFKEMMTREHCVEEDSDNPECYRMVTTDKEASPRRGKRKSSFLLDYKEIYRSGKEESTEEYFKTRKVPRGAGPKGLKRISAETQLPMKYLRKVYNAGVGAYATSGSRVGMTPEQWGYGRVYAFVMSYFHNHNGEYNSRRYLRNKTDFHIFEGIVEDML